MDDDYERVLLVKNQCFVYRLPPRPSVSRGYRAADWKLDEPQWTCRMRIVSKSDKVLIKLEDKVSGNLFAKAPIDTYPGVAIESVSDSSRYFVLRIMDDSGRTAFIGVGFQDRGDSFDFNVALQDHFKRAKTEEEECSKSSEPQPNLNLGLKEGQTFTIKLGNKASKPRPKPVNSLGTGFLPPPPRAASSNTGLLIAPPPSNTAKKQTAPTTSGNDWGEFSSAPTNSGNSNSTANQWMQFQ